VRQFQNFNSQSQVDRFHDLALLSQQSQEPPGFLQRDFTGCGTRHDRLSGFGQIRGFRHSWEIEHHGPRTARNQPVDAEPQSDGVSGFGELHRFRHHRFTRSIQQIQAEDRAFVAAPARSSGRVSALPWDESLSRTSRRFLLLIVVITHDRVWPCTWSVSLFRVRG
jgi:hypothetical protein